MEEARLIGGTETGVTAGVPVEGDLSAGAGPAPATGSLSSIPRSAEASSPDVIRAILSDVPRLRPAGSTVWGASGSAVIVDEGAVHLTPVDQALSDVVAQAGRTGSPFTLLLARPGPATAMSTTAPPVTAASVADLAASLSVSLNPAQELYSAGPGYLAAVIPGRSSVGRREAMRLTRRAAAEGAPVFTWAAALYPRDATTAAGLVETASNRLDGRLVSRTNDFGAREPRRNASRSGAAVWGGVAAAVLLGALFLALHGPSGAPHVSTGTISPGQGGSGGTGSGVQQVSDSGGGGSLPSGGAGGGTGTSGSSSSPGAAVPAGQSGTANAPGGAQSSDTTIAGSTATTVPVGGGGGGGATTTTVVSNSSTTTTTTTTDPCAGLVQSLTCTANNIVNKTGGKLGL